MRAFLIVLDSVGIGEAPDAAAYDDVGANTLGHTAQEAGPLKLPFMTGLGLGNIGYFTRPLSIARTISRICSMNCTPGKMPSGAYSRESSSSSR